MARNYSFTPGEYYHLYARGFEKVPVFKDDGDYKRFVECLYLLNDKSPISIRDIKRNLTRGLTSGQILPGELGIFTVKRNDILTDIGAYCLMPNHFHILVHEKVEGGISKFMQKLMTSYTMYINKKYDRTGALFGSSFRAVHVTDDNHLKYLFAYIHLNPKEITGADKLREYTYSSYQDYVNNHRPQTSILNQSTFPDYFSNNIEEEIKEWITEDPPEV